MASRPDRRPRRPDSKQMWDEQDKRAPIPSRERDEQPRRDERDRRGRDDWERNRRYRSRSPRERGDDRGYKERSREAGRERNGDRGGRDGGRRDERDSKAGGRDGARRDERENNGRRERERERDREAPSHRDRRERSRSRERARDTGRKNDRSRSPRKDSRREEEQERPKSSRFDDDFSKSRTSTPPVSFKVSTPTPSHPLSTHEDEHMEVDREYQSKKSSDIKVKKDKAPAKDREVSEDDVDIVQDDSMADMAAMMGFGGFGTTQNKKVAGNNIGAIRKEKKTEYRQYMNRVGGFNRPLSPPRGD